MSLEVFRSTDAASKSAEKWKLSLPGWKNFKEAFCSSNRSKSSGMTVPPAVRHGEALDAETNQRCVPRRISFVCGSTTRIGPDREMQESGIDCRQATTRYGRRQK